MRNFEVIPCEDYDSFYNVNYTRVPCYSDKKIKSVYPDGFAVAGEVFCYNKKDKANDIGVVILGDKPLHVKRSGTFSTKTYKINRYIKVGENEFLALAKMKFLSKIWPYAAVVIAFIIGLIIIFWPNR